MASSAYTTIVNVSPETAPLLTDFVCNLVASQKGPEAGRTLYNDCQVLIEGAKTETLLLKLLDQSESILNAEKETGKAC